MQVKEHNIIEANKPREFTKNNEIRTNQYTFFIQYVASLE